MYPNRSSEPLSLEARIRALLVDLPVSEKRMFGGLTFLLNGNMLCCASKKGLMVRVGKEAEPRALANPMAKRCAGAGRPMPGFISIEADGIGGDEALAGWLEMALAYVGSLPPKTEKFKVKPRRLARKTN